MNVLIGSVDYADFLSYTLPAWQKILPANATLTVVTAPDAPDIAVCQQHGARTHITDAFYRKNHVFDIAAAKDEAANALGVGEDEWLLSLDADIYPVGKFPTIDYEPNTMYGITRGHANRLLDFKRFLSGVHTIDCFPVTEFYGCHKPGPTTNPILGYFQLWRYSRARGWVFGSYKDASQWDMVLTAKVTNHYVLKELQGLHLGYPKKNWQGRITEKWS